MLPDRFRASEKKLAPSKIKLVRKIQQLQHTTDFLELSH